MEKIKQRPQKRNYLPKARGKTQRRSLQGIKSKRMPTKKEWKNRNSPMIGNNGLI